MKNNDNKRLEAAVINADISEQSAAQAQAEQNLAAGGVQPQEGLVNYKLSPKLRFQQFFYELGALVKDAIFPFIVMCVFSTTIILFYSFEDVAVQILATVLGEALMIGAFVMFGRQNGAAAYRKYKINDGKRKLGKREKKVVFRTGEYSPWKGFVTGFISAVPFLILQIIKCTGEYDFVNFMLEYACGWAVAPLNVISSSIPQPYYLLMIIFPVCIHGGFYIQGMFAERKRQEIITRAEDDMKKGRKKHYYDENTYESDRKVVDIPENSRGKKRK